jgi:ubiquinone/menaquinone biosynthesis C-methylase UbiE
MRVGWHPRLGGAQPRSEDLEDLNLLSLYRRRRQGIPRQQYTRDYFLSDRCEGFREFRAERGLSHVKSRLVSRIEPQPGERLLELGCGRGEVLRCCAERGAIAVGLDYSREAVRLSRETCAGKGLLVQADATALPFRRCTFRKVFLGDVLEHLTRAQAERMIGEAHRVLEPEGRLIVHTSPNVLFVRLVFPWALIALAAIGRWRLVGLLIDQYRTIREFHVREYSAGRLRRLLRGSAFARTRVECDPDVLRGGKSRYTESLAASAWVRGAAHLVAREPWVRLVSNDLWAEAEKGPVSSNGSG